MKARAQSTRGFALAAVALVVLLLCVLFARAGSGDGAVETGLDGIGNAAADPDRPADLGVAPVLVETDEPSRLATATGGLSVRLRGPGRLRGTVRERGTGAGIAGVSVDLLAVPPAGAEVAAQITRFIGSAADFRARVAPLATTTTDEAGSFAFEGVREGRWYLRPEAPHHVGDAPVSARVLASGADGPVDVWMRPGGRVVGRVEREDGSPVAGAEVALTTSSMGIMEAAADGEVAFLRQTADRDGRFAFPGVAPAEGYEIAAIGQGIAVTHVLDLEVRAGEDTTVLVTGLRGGRVRGRIVAASTGGSPTGEPSEPVAGAKVGALPRGLRHLKLAKEILIATHTTTGEDGSYVLDGLPPGDVDLLSMADDYVPARGPLVRIPRTAGAEVSAPDFALIRGPKVRGRVVDVGGSPVAGARILWNVIDVASVQGQPSIAPLFAAGMEEFEFPVTDADGNFRAGPLGGEPPYALRAIRSGFEVGRVEWDGRDPAGAVVEIVLSRGGSVVGQVLDAATDEPVASFTAGISGRIEPDPGAPSRFNPFAGGAEFEHPEGRFQLEQVAVGAQVLSVTAEGYLPAEIPLEVTDLGVPVAASVRLEPGATLRGFIVDGNGEPIAGAQVTTEALVAASFQRLEWGRGAIESALAVKGRPPMRRPPPVGLLRHLVALGFLGEGVVSSGSDGSFVLRGLEPAEVEVLGFHRDFKAGAVLTVLERGDGNEPVTLTLTQGGGLRGKVTDRFGQPVADAMVLAVSPGLAGGPTSNGEFHQARSRTDGTYEMLNMDGGPFLIVATRGDENLSIMSFLGTLNFGLVNVPPERIVTHNLVDTSAAACRVTGVVTRGGVPVKGGLLLALNLDSEGLLGLDFKAAPIENDGSYVFAGLSPGEYQVTFEGEGPRGESIIDVPDAPQLVHDVALPEGTLTGRLVAGDTGEPVRGVRVRLVSTERSSGGGITATISRGMVEGFAAGRRSSRDGTQRVDDDGRYRFTGLDEGRYQLQLVGDAISAPYAPPTDLVFSLGVNERLDAGDIALDPGKAVRGRVVDGDGAPVAGAEVVALSDARRGPLPRRCVTGEDGLFEVRGLAEGSWELLPSAEGFAPSAATAVTVDDSGEPDELELVLLRGAEVEVLVLDGAGAPRSGVACVLERAGEGRGTSSSASGSLFGGALGGTFQRFFRGSSTTDGEGRLDLGRFGPGAYTLRASQGFQRADRAVEVKAGSRQRLQIVLD